MSPALGNALVSCSITVIAKGSSIFHENVSPASPSLTLSWLERFRHAKCGCSTTHSMNVEVLFSVSQILLRLISEPLTGLACDEGREGESRQLKNWNKTDVNHSSTG